MTTSRKEMSDFLRTVINMNWLEFCKAEKDGSYTGLQAVVFALVRATSESKLGAIKAAINRIDGKVETPVEVIYPKVFMVYPYAKSVAGLPAGDLPVLANEKPDEPEASQQPEDLATFTLRDTLRKMSQTERPVIPLILEKKNKVEEAFKYGGDVVEKNIPLVKSVIAANLLYLATEKNNFEAITEIFDQLEGKLVETFRVLGDDIYLTQYTDVAPYGAVKNKDGIYMIQERNITDQWAQKFESSDS